MRRYPIDTAPKDGTWVLLFGGKTGDGDDAVCGTPTDPTQRAAQEREIKRDNERPVVAKWEACGTPLGEGAWVFAAWDSSWRSSYEGPTEWCAL